jgi:heme/copper-type cytochrome/quinol oxidase subunit 3
MALFAATESALFGVLLGTYYYLEFRSPAWPPPGIAAPAAVLPLALAGALALATAPMLLAARAASRGARRAAWLLVAVALAVQSGYLAWQVVLYADDLGRFSPDGSAYGSIYFMLLGAAHAHVALGLLLDLWLLARLATGLTRYRAVAVRAVSIYWVFVAAVTVLVTLTQVSPS